MSENREIGGASAALLLGTVGVQAIGFVRALVIARLYGTGPALDAYYAALTLPSLVGAMITISAEAALLPLYLERRERAGGEAAERVYGRSCLATVAALAALAGVLAAGAGLWAVLLAPGFGPDQRALTAHLLRVSAPILIFSGASDLLATLFMAHRRFALPIAAPLLGAAVSLAALVGAREAGPVALPASLLLGGAAQVSLLLLAMPRAGLRLRLGGAAPAASAAPPTSPSAASSLLTLLGSSGLGNLTIAVDRMFASACPPGSVAVLSYGLNLSTVPSQLFIKTVDSAVFPFLSRQAAEGRQEELRATFRRAVRLTLVLVAPTTAAILVLAPEAVALVFERGSFGPDSTRAVAAAWRIYALGLVFKVLVSMSARVLSACRETRALLWSAAAGLLATLAFNAALVPLLSYLGIALSGALSAAVVATAQLALARSRLGPLGLASLLAPIGATIASAAASGAAMFAVRQALAGPPAAALLAAGAAGLAVYLACMALACGEDLRALGRLGARMLPGAGGAA